MSVHSRRLHLVFSLWAILTNVWRHPKIYLRFQLPRECRSTALTTNSLHNQAQILLIAQQSISIQLHSALIKLSYSSAPKCAPYRMLCCLFPLSSCIPIFLSGSKLNYLPSLSTFPNPVHSSGSKNCPGCICMIFPQVQPATISAPSEFLKHAPEAHFLFVIHYCDISYLSHVSICLFYCS